MSSSRFDQAAAGWDENPVRVALAQQIVAAILAQVPVRKSMTAIDFGCGTGLVTLALAPHVQRITGIDTSPGMLEVLSQKVRALNVTNVDMRECDLGNDCATDLHADLIVSSMALHHVEDVSRLLKQFARILTPGGFLALADLESEDGTFHEDTTGVYHSGLDPAGLIEQLAALGFVNLCSSTAYTIERPNQDGTRRYPVFLVSGQKAQY